MSAIKIYTDIALLKENVPNVHLFPLIDSLLTEKGLISNADFEFVVDAEDCDMFLLPVTVDYMLGLGRKKEIEAFIDKAKSICKKVLVFTTGDIGLTLKFANVLILRLGGFKSKTEKETFIMPPFIEDPYAKLKHSFLTIEKKENPIIGFVGHANGGFIKLVKEIVSFIKLNAFRLLRIKYIDFQSFYPSSLRRFKYLNLLEKETTIKTNFVYRNSYRAGVKTNKDLEATTIEFYENMNKNAYTFCMRGLGNFSVRFYETLAMGRIPILVDTDCKLPFSDSIDWKKHCFIIDEVEIANIGPRLLDFHKSITVEDFKKIQVSNRLLWETYFTKENFFIQLKKVLLKELK
ncbi:exostosin domain-containing protein [Winogradskyella wichelsiae]|uniref:exostosin domain-containing protein n=1 Tax=Winogradskyella wichelsiae TaxID=2697007 RepID=UPI0015CB80E9|nr:exostosin family protein [Winogradskyella wichelsiae]